MRYVGGKSRLGKHIADVIRMHGKHRIGDPIWEPFCGGLGATLHLSTLGPVICADVNLALITLYCAVRDGWTPPDITETMHAKAKYLPDTDPLKAAARYGRSFGGNFSSGFARNDARNNYDSQLRSSLNRCVKSAFSFDCYSFFDTPTENGITCYFDPPYAGTLGYGSDFDNAAFWRRADDWSAHSHVYVSEFAAPDDWDCVWSFERKTNIGLRSKLKDVHVERLFYRGPESA